MTTPFILYDDLFCKRDSGLPLSENFDGLSLTGAEIFAFEICLEICTNFGEKIQF